MGLRDKPLLAGAGEFDEISWHIAQERIKWLGYFARSFTGCIRLLRQHRAYEGGAAGKLHPDCRFHLCRLLSSKTILAHYYYLSLTFYKSRIEDAYVLPAQFFLDLFTAEDHATILTLIYLYHRIRKASNKEEFPKLAKILQETIDVGGLLGRKVPSLKFAEGLLIGGIRHLALAMCMGLDLGAYRIYRRNMLQNESGFDQRAEIQSLGCSHVQVACLLLQEMGMGIEFAQSFKTALITKPSKPLNSEHNRLRVTALWTDALYYGVRPPPIAGEIDFFVSEEALDDLALGAAKISKTGSAHSWLMKTRNSISKRLHPRLFADPDDFEEWEPDEEGANQLFSND